MSSTDLHRALVLAPYLATTRPVGDEEPVELPLNEALEALSRDVRTVTDLVEWHLGSDGGFLDNLQENGGTKPGSGLGQALGVTFPKGLFPRRTGSSRLLKMAMGRLVAEGRSWLARMDAATGEYGGYVSAGWKRTADSTRPTDLIPLMRLSDADEKYSKFVGDPTSGEFVLDVVVNGSWVRFHFRVKRSRLNGAKRVAKPAIRVNENGTPVFHFTAVFEHQAVEFSRKYILGVDVGINVPATVVVVDADSGRIVHATPLSRRVASVRNSIAATARQVTALQKQGRREEAVLHRVANVRKKQELAILIGQEIADIAHTWDNAVVAVEDLSWIDNTMANGRWNRGEVIRRTRDMVELNGGRAVTVNAANTSRVCHECGEPVTFHGWSTVECAPCGTLLDRDVNAAANIAKRLAAKGTWQKMRDTRRKSKTFRQGRASKRTVETRQSLKYPGRDRTKNRSTPTRVGPATVQVMPTPIIREGVNDGMCSATHNDDGTVVADDRGKQHPGGTSRQHDSLPLIVPSGP